MTSKNTEKVSLIIHINNNEKNVPSYQREEQKIPFQSCKSALTFSEQVSGSLAIPGNIFLAPVKVIKSGKDLLQQIMFILKSHLLEHLVDLTVTIPNLRPF